MKEMKAYTDKIVNRRGFTLLEIMIAMFILTFAMLALVSVTVSVVKGNAANKMTTTATTLAKDQLETLKNEGLTSDTGFDGIASTSWAAVSGFPGYERQWTVTTVSGNSSCTAAGAPSTCCTGAGTGSCPVRKNVAMQGRYLWQGSYKIVTLNTIIIKK
jgi:prepilin-type N-terminal cleavage/methylation domain-containing protein